MRANAKFLPPLRVDANFMRANVKALFPLRVNVNFMRANAKSLPSLRVDAIACVRFSLLPWYVE